MFRNIPMGIPNVSAHHKLDVTAEGGINPDPAQIRSS
jgi:hypothetical protein